MTAPVRRPHRAALPALAAAIAFACSAAHAGGGPRYHFERIDVPGAAHVVVKDINDAGQVVGTYFDQDFVKHAVLWDAKGSHRLAVPDGLEVHGVAYAINNHGQIAGYADSFEDSSPGLTWNAATPDTYMKLSDDPIVVAIPNDINDDGVIVGLKGGYQTGEKFHAFVWTAQGGLVDYGTANPDDASQNAIWSGINASGQLVGGWNYTRQIYHATRGTLGTPAVVPFNNDTEVIESFADAINASGVAVGYADLGAPRGPVAARFETDGTIAEIPGASFDSDAGFASAINDAGVIVGRATNLSTRTGLKAWVYVDGQAWDLFEQVDDTGGLALFTDAVAINASGVIVGTGEFEDGTMASFRLTPIASDAIFADGFEAP
ncbi:DUF3466 family protein [Tahibacter soli]|uniref:DUF3466 family protein n=1 Tax=Tahibacter soli TaxID=2983605 RepID=A0A9X4BHJ0_9GAMM|nr:DUF3466 family protein [Tahibacter soli]MDC8012448.1 DUF3466 family protein [Tahibacter soli]